MIQVNALKVPPELASFPQWVLWSLANRDGKPTKVPLQPDRRPAKSNDPATWATFATACAAYDRGGFSGIGFMFSPADPFCGIDLDGCRDPATTRVSEWARSIILRFGSYAEVSPSETGVKIFCRGNNPLGSGRKLALSQVERVGSKDPAIEIYDELRYFAVTGWTLANHGALAEGQEHLDWLKATYFADHVPTQPTLDFRSDEAVIERARKYIARLPPAISGQDGHGRTFHAACVLVCGFSLAEHDAMSLMREFNAACVPPWTEKELLHKVQSAQKQGGQRGYLRDAAPQNWAKIAVPSYMEPKPPVEKSEPRITTLIKATRAYVDTIRNGGSSLVELGISELNYAIGGGVEKGEMVIFAARPSHCKSAVALQCLHYWTSTGKPCAIVSEEMSSLMLGKRTLQFSTAIHQEHWRDLILEVDADIDEYANTHAECLILEGCGTSYAAVEAIEKAVKSKAVECVVVDYAQLLRSYGKSRYEQITNTSVMLRQLASSQKIVLLVLAQLSRAIESRTNFTPMLSDLKDSGQLEQDADVITFLVWPWRLDPTVDQRKFQFYVEKNRNRPINQKGVTCRFIAERQKILESIPEIPDIPVGWQNTL